MNSSLLIESIFNGIKNTIGCKTTKNNKIVLHEPNFEDTNSLKYLSECINKNWVSSGGEFVNQFERKLCEFTGAKHSIAITNGTNAIRMALHILGVSLNDEVIMPPLSFVATANAISHLGAFPHFVDIDSSTLGLCPIALEKHLNLIAKKKIILYLINSRVGG